MCLISVTIMVLPKKKFTLPIDSSHAALALEVHKEKLPFKAKFKNSFLYKWSNEIDTILGSIAILIFAIGYIYDIFKKVQGSKISPGMCIFVASCMLFASMLLAFSSLMFGIIIGFHKNVYRPYRDVNKGKRIPIENLYGAGINYFVGVFDSAISIVMFFTGILELFIACSMAKDPIIARNLTLTYLFVAIGGVLFFLSAATGLLAASIKIHHGNRIQRHTERKVNIAVKILSFFVFISASLLLLGALARMLILLEVIDPFPLLRKHDILPEVIRAVGLVLMVIAILCVYFIPYVISKHGIKKQNELVKIKITQIENMTTAFTKVKQFHEKMKDITTKHSELTKKAKEYFGEHLYIDDVTLKNQMTVTQTQSLLQLAKDLIFAISSDVTFFDPCFKMSVINEKLTLIDSQSLKNSIYNLIKAVQRIVEEYKIKCSANKRLKIAIDKFSQLGTEQEQRSFAMSDEFEDIKERFLIALESDIALAKCTVLFLGMSSHDVWSGKCVSVDKEKLCSQFTTPTLALETLEAALTVTDAQIMKLMGTPKGKTDAALSYQTTIEQPEQEKEMY